MHFLDVLFYQFYLFYKKILKDPDPTFATVLGISVCEGIVIIAPLDYLCSKNCFDCPTWVYFSVFVIIAIINYFAYLSSRRVQELIKQRPLFFNSIPFTIAFTVIFFLGTLSWFFWSTYVYGIKFHEACKYKLH
jgi:hypothetical protein